MVQVACCHPRRITATAGPPDHMGAKLSQLFNKTKTENSTTSSKIDNGGGEKVPETPPTPKPSKSKAKKKKKSSEEGGNNGSKKKASRESKVKPLPSDKTDNNRESKKKTTTTKKTPKKAPVVQLERSEAIVPRSTTVAQSSNDTTQGVAQERVASWIISCQAPSSSSIRPYRATKLKSTTNNPCNHRKTGPRGIIVYKDGKGREKVRMLGSNGS